MTTETTYNVLDLFCGCGGLSLGFEQAGFHVLLGIDIWEDALKTYKHNHTSSRTLCADMSSLTGKEVADIINGEKVDVIIGGPPCQGFSIAGKRIVDDERNKLYKGFVRMVEYFKPKAFVMENVPNILSIGNGVVKDTIIRDFESLGYTVAVKVLLASDYGVPQNRRRAIFVGLRGGNEFIFPIPFNTKKVTAEEALSDLPEHTVDDGGAYPFPPLSQYQQLMRSKSNCLYNHQTTTHNQKTIDIISLVPDGGNYKDLPVELQSTRKVHIAWTRLCSTKPSFTIDTGHNHHFHYLYNRVPTVRESARLQSFPDIFVFLGNKGSQLRQVGNAVPIFFKTNSLSIKKIYVMYTPENQYRCTIIRGKSQTEMEDLLPVYANIVHKYCPCTEETFRNSAFSDLSYTLFHTREFSQLPKNKQKTVKNHYTEIMGVLLGLFYPKYDAEAKEVIIHETDSCRFLIEKSDFPTFFKNLCLNYQFPNGEKKITTIQKEMELGIKLKPFCFVVKLLHIANSHKQLLSKQEIGYYALNNLDVLCGNVSADEVFNRIMEDRLNGIKRNKLSGSNEWQHIKEQFNLLELANLVEHDSERIWLNSEEASAIALFIKKQNSPMFDVYSYNLNTTVRRKQIVQDWKEYNGKFNMELLNTSPVLGYIDNAKLKGGVTAIKSTTDLGNEGEALVFKLEQERVKFYKERLVNKVLLLGKTKGLGYDISSIEADENPENPEFARYIEVKSTRRTTRPSFNQNWTDSLNITRKEWVAAQQFGTAYNIYRVYFTKSEVIVVRIHNPFALSKEGKIEVFPTVYQMDFSSNVIQKSYTI